MRQQYQTKETTKIRQMKKFYQNILDGKRKHVKGNHKELQYHSSLAVQVVRSKKIHGDINSTTIQSCDRLAIQCNGICCQDPAQNNMILSTHRLGQVGSC
jgi:hypothetical protein